MRSVARGIVAALLIALLVAGISLTTELIGPAGLEDGAEAETLVLSGTVVVLTLGLAALLVARLDNLGKGAAGAAVQNLDLMMGKTAVSA